MSSCGKMTRYGDIVVKLTKLKYVFLELIVYLL